MNKSGENLNIMVGRMGSVLEWEEEKARCVGSLPWVPQLCVPTAFRKAPCQVMEDSDAAELRSSEQVCILKSGSWWRWWSAGLRERQHSTWLWKADPSAQATAYNIHMGSCSGFRDLKKRASSSLCVLLLSTWSTILSWLRPSSWAPDLCNHTLPCTQKGPMLGVMLGWSCLDKGPYICILHWASRIT